MHFTFCQRWGIVLINISFSFYLILLQFYFLLLFHWIYYYLHFWINTYCTVGGKYYDDDDLLSTMKYDGFVDLKYWNISQGILRTMIDSSNQLEMNFTCLLWRFCNSDPGLISSGSSVAKIIALLFAGSLRFPIVAIIGCDSDSCDS